MTDNLLSTGEASQLLGVSPSAIKRWANEGLLPCSRTAGGHRRFRREDVLAVQDAAQRSTSGRSAETSELTDLNDLDSSVQSELTDWVERLVEGGDVAELVKVLRAQRESLGSWWALADFVGQVLTALGHAWQSGAVSILDEHVASERLRRAILICAQEFRPPPDARLAILAGASGEDHIMGLVLSELVLRAQGWRVVWAGARTPVGPLIEYVRREAPKLVGISASPYAMDQMGLAAEADSLTRICRQVGATLVLGGTGLWPDPPPAGAVRARTFEDFRRILG